jgi:hypothetical protein
MEDMMSNKFEMLFRVALILCPFGTALTFSRMILGINLPEEAIRYNEWFSSHQMNNADIFGFICTVLADIFVIISIIGMFLYFSKARYLFIAALILYLVSALLVPRPVLIDNIDSASTYISSIVAGVVLAMSFLSPIREKFETNRLNVEKSK